MDKFQIIDEIKKMFKYGIVGVMNTMIFASIAWLAKKIGLNYMLYTLIGYLVAILFSFFMNKQFTFNNDEKEFKTMFIKFLCVTLSLLGCVQIIQYTLIELIGFKELLGVISGMCFYTGAGFFLNRFFVFSNNVS